MKTATTLKENCEDISAAADEINEERMRRKEEKEIADAKAILASHGENAQIEEKNS
jgi:hypothetical protein